MLTSQLSNCLKTLNRQVICPCQCFMSAPDRTCILLWGFFLWYRLLWCPLLVSTRSFYLKKSCHGPYKDSVLLNRYSLFFYWCSIYTKLNVYRARLKSLITELDTVRHLCGFHGAVINLTQLARLEPVARENILCLTTSGDRYSSWNGNLVPLVMPLWEGLVIGVL